MNLFLKYPIKKKIFQTMSTQYIQKVKKLVPAINLVKRTYRFFRGKLFYLIAIR